MFSTLCNPVVKPIIVKWRYRMCFLRRPLRIAFSFLLLFSFAGILCAESNNKTIVVPFSLKDVRLLESPFKRAQEKDARYLLSVEPDCLLAKYRINAGLKPKKPHYGGWEDRSISGHSLGHYLSAVSLMYAATGDERFKDVSDYIVDELSICQEAGKDGLVSGVPDIRKVFEEVSKGNIRSAGFDLNGLWVPWYTQHKVFAGLADAYRCCDNQKALEIMRKLGDWGIEATENLSEEQFQKMIDCEFGGVNESYYDLYSLTGEKKYLEMGDRFHHKKVIDPFFNGVDALPGKHGNTQFPKVIGLARKYESIDEGEEIRKAIEFFWDRVVNHHSYVTGGNTMGEHFAAPDRLNDRLSDNTTETCNTYNMLKLTRHLYTWTGNPEYLDFYERALFNHILASIDFSENSNSLFTYFVPLQGGGFRTYSTASTHWTCCHGTGMENHAKYGDSIFFRGKNDDRDVLYVNLLIPSVLDWNEKGIKVTITDDFRTIIESKDDRELDVLVREPRNMKCDSELVSGYFKIGSKWSEGKSERKLPFSYEYAIESMPDNKDRIAFFKGPWLLAGNLGPANKPLAAPLEPIGENKISIPVLLAETRDPSELIADKDDCCLCGNHAMRVESTRPNPVDLVPFYRANQRYIVYFDIFNEKQWSEIEEKYKAEAERLRKLEEMSVDFFQPGEMQPERDHNLKSENSHNGEAFSRKWRDAREGGYFEFDMKRDTTKKCALVLTYWGGEVGNRKFDILIDGKKIETQTLQNNAPGKFFDVVHEIPTGANETIRVRLQPHKDNWAGGLFGARVMIDEP